MCKNVNPTYGAGIRTHNLLITSLLPQPLDLAPAHYVLLFVEHLFHLLLQLFVVRNMRYFLNFSLSVRLQIFAVNLSVCAIACIFVNRKLRSVKNINKACLKLVSEQFFDIKTNLIHSQNNREISFLKRAIAQTWTFAACSTEVKCLPSL